jgi:hypothetical protein
VALREVDSDASIPTQIEQYINAITADRIESWARLSAQFKNNPPVLILDGYDELLQASGKVFSGYLKDVRNFQKSEAEQGRPIRALVTSRLTLIDKASIPEGATIVRLLEFDKQQRDAWTAIWNSTNATYFSESDPAVEPFALPADADPKGKNVLSLAEQPLLLLMLALYDSEGNRLRHSQGIDRTALYDSLLRRFVARERGKDFDFERLPKSQQEQEIDRDMQRLGVAAIGMYNRRKLFIASPELDQDLRHFELERKVVVESGRPLSQADMLLGSFFFVHKSKLLQRTEMPDQYEEAAAFEFLHNTFGEFLTADFILRQALVESQLLTEFRSTDALRAELVRRLDRADAFSRAWFTCLIYTPLFSRPVVLEMLREWTRHSLRDKPVAYEPFLAALDEIVVNQIKRVLSRSHMPPAISGDMPGPFPRYPMLGHLAIYTLNLIILRTVLSDVYEFDESIIGSHEDGARPWDQLTHVWRSWFSMENLNGLAAILTAKRSGSKILLVPRDSFSIPTSSGRLETVLNVSRAVGDNVTAGLAGLSAYDAGSDNRLGLDRIDEALSSESIDVRTQLSLKRLIEAANETEFGKYDRLTDLASDVIERSFESGRVDELRQAIDLISARYPLLRVRARIFQHLGWNKAESAARRRPEILNEVFRLGQFRGRVLFVDDRAVLVRGLGNRSFSGEFQGAGFDWASMGASAFHERSQLAATEALFGQPPGDIGYPETIGELLHKGRLAKARRLPEGTAEKLISEIDKRGGINELARHRPDVLFEVITTLGKRDAERLLGELHGQWMEPLLTPSGFSELVDRRPPVAIELLRRLLGRVRPGVELPISRDSLRGLVRALLDPEAVAHFASVRPTVLHPMLRVLERGGAEFIDSEVRGKWGSAWQPGFVAVLLSTNPEVAVALLRLLRMILDNEAVRRFAEEVFRQQTDVRSLALQGYSPVCSEMLQLVREVGGERLLSRVAELLLDVYSRPGRKNTFFDRMPMGLAGELKRFAEAAGNATLSQVIVEGVAAVMRD